MEPLTILGIETSCDETAVSILSISSRSEFRIHTELLSSQVDIHREYGGVVPEIASREHLAALPLLIDKAFAEAGISMSSAHKRISGMGVTCGPGLKGCLLVGITFAQGFAGAHRIPLIGVNHIEGHILSTVMDNPGITFPFLSLIVSGGHTEIVLVQEPGKYILVTRTRDDAAGEAFDKSANLLGFGYPGGKDLAEAADKVDSSKYILPKVMREHRDFSFSGLKTAISLLVAKERESIERDPRLRHELCFAVQDSIVEALVSKLMKAVEEYGVSTIGVAGGVSANKFLRKKLLGLKQLEVYFPDYAHCTDNAAMIAYTAGLHFLKTGLADGSCEIEAIPSAAINEFLSLP